MAQADFPNAPNELQPPVSEAAQMTILAFAQDLSQRHYTQAHQRLSARLQTHLPLGALQDAFEQIIPLDWGPVDPIEIEGIIGQKSGRGTGNLMVPVMVVLGGDVYSEALFVDRVVREAEILKIDGVEFGRP
ncbi:MAG: hypothetical protein ACO4AI_06035 [Prochlorothrix sp.]